MISGILSGSDGFLMLPRSTSESRGVTPETASERTLSLVEWVYVPRSYPSSAERP